MELLLDEQGHAVLRNGKPVYKDPTDGKEIEFDAGQAFGKIKQLTGENTAYKKRFNEAEDKLKLFEGIDDPAAALKAIETVANFDQKKFIDAGEVEKLKADISKSFTDQIESLKKGHEAKMTEATARAASLEKSLNEELIGGNFARSKFISEKLAIPADMARAFFGSAFTIEDGKVVANDSTGTKIFSRSKMGDVAEFDEAIEILVDQYPNKDSIMKGNGASGGGAQGGNGGGANSKSMKRDAFFAQSPADQAAYVKGGGTVID